MVKQNYWLIGESKFNGRMRISLEWLQELVDFSMSPEELADMLTMAGFEVEDIEDRRTWADGVVIGHVLDRQPHPDADKLKRLHGGYWSRGTLQYCVWSQKCESRVSMCPSPLLGRSCRS